MEKTSKFNKKTPVYKLPWGAIYKPPCVRLINNPFFAIHQVFALSISGPPPPPQKFAPKLVGIPLQLHFLGPATTQNFVVKFGGEICGGVLVEHASDDFPSKRSSKISFQCSPEVRHQFRRKLRQLHSGNRWCLAFLSPKFIHADFLLTGETNHCIPNTPLICIPLLFETIGNWGFTQ